MKEIKKVCVAGAGLMGKQIALNAAVGGYEVTLYDSFPAAAEKAAVWAKDFLTGRVQKGKMAQDVAEGALARFKIVGDLAEAATGADLVIEAIIEKEDEKKKFFQQVNGLVDQDALIATNSSFMVSSRFVDCVSNPARLANLHYFNPAMAMKLVEIVKGPHTADETVQALYDFVKKVGKMPVIIQKEWNGFIVNHISSAITVAALELLENGVATPEDIDIAMENGLNHPMGTFRLMDLTGINLTYTVMAEKKEKGLPVPGFAQVKEKYDAGKYGRSTGEGWYKY